MLNVGFPEKMRSLGDPETRVPKTGTRATLRLFLICELTVNCLVRSTEVSMEEPIITRATRRVLGRLYHFDKFNRD
jgi:hypothetical protein